MAVEFCTGMFDPETQEEPGMGMWDHKKCMAEYPSATVSQPCQIEAANEQDVGMPLVLLIS